MPNIRESRELPYSAEQMFDLVADVAKYQKFLPWVVATRVRSDSETEMVADMMVGFKALREKFTSKVHKERPTRIVVEYVDGPLNHLENSWHFEPLGPGRCRIDFCVDFTFRSAVFETMAGAYLDRAFRKMVGAFETRAGELYGQPAA
ncbi:type II toxin-antitoxin system RatA family toxin [Croceicoccus naphthovorans]|uniref:Cyclase n=1 Tax=Croceicoccus naphthovorans TaxID=1348774 RepID=A0A0G3XHJ2_9SPHN|nr:type II toxin-antitoxin system RatA family toxin [Croceicoccus naphthovorans]AKM10059.1 cyclase [Croceicoccus naphthovorans]MBB3991226.1 coenzyme Q-binding protein COQ10 [Croceicoccus naphthovorans]